MAQKHNPSGLTPEQREAQKQKEANEKAAREHKAQQGREAATKAKAQAGIDAARKAREEREAKRKT